MRALTLNSYFPSGFSALAKPDRSGFSSYLETAETLIFGTIAKAFLNLDRHLPSTEESTVIARYLRAMGFDLPEDRHEILSRCFQLHRRYLENRGRKEGILILCKILTGQEPEIMSDFEIKTLGFMNSKLHTGKSRLLHQSKGSKVVLLTFPKELAPEEISLLKKFLNEDQPAGCRFLIRALKIKLSQKATGAVRLGKRRLSGVRLCAA